MNQIGLHLTFSPSLFPPGEEDSSSLCGHSTLHGQSREPVGKSSFWSRVADPCLSVWHSEDFMGLIPGAGYFGVYGLTF